MKFSEPIYKRVSKEEFEDFIKNYPVDLEIEKNTSYIPTQIGYYDRDLENITYHLVAETYDYDGMLIDNDKKIYRILDNLDDLYISLEEELDKLEDEAIREPKRHYEKLLKEAKEFEEKIKQEVDNE